MRRTIVCRSCANWRAGELAADGWAAACKNVELVGRSNISRVLVLDPNASEASHGSEARHARSEATRLVFVNCT